VAVAVVEEARTMVPEVAESVCWEKVPAAQVADCSTWLVEVPAVKMEVLTQDYVSLLAEDMAEAAQAQETMIMVAVVVVA
jgi:hypothetical protein